MATKKSESRSERSVERPMVRKLEKARTARSAKSGQIELRASDGAVIFSGGPVKKAYRLSLETGKPQRVIVEIKPSGRYVVVRPAAHTGRGVGESSTTSDGDAPPDLDEELAAARKRGQARVAEILADDEMLSAEAFGALIGTSRVTVNDKRRRHEVLGIEGAKRGFRYPAWQLGPEGKPFSVLPDLFDVLGGSPWAVYRFLVQRHPELGGRTGRDTLQQGQTKAALDVAQDVATGSGA